MKITTHIDVNVSDNTAWAFIGEKFGEIGDWLTLLKSSHLTGPLKVGTSRICVLSNGKEATENLTVFDPENHWLTYVATTGTPPMFSLAKNSWSVSSLDTGTSCITSVANIRLKWWAAPLIPVVYVGLRTTMKKVRSQVKYAVENGRPHPDVIKQKSMARTKTMQQKPRNA